MNLFYVGFEKQAKMTTARRSKDEAELYEFNKKNIKPGKATLVGAGLGAGLGGVSGALGGAVTGGLRGAIGGGLAGALGGGVAAGATFGGGALYQKHRGPGYLKDISDKNLGRTVAHSRKYTAGDTKAMNRNYWKQQIDEAKGEKNKQVFRDMLAKEK